MNTILSATMADSTITIGAIILLIGTFGALVYIACLPTIIANRRSHPARQAIFVVNLFLGGTLLGWVIALAWALNGEGNIPSPRTTVRTLQYLGLIVFGVFAFYIIIIASQPQQAPTSTTNHIIRYVDNNNKTTPYERPHNLELQKVLEEYGQEIH